MSTSAQGSTPSGEPRRPSGGARAQATFVISVAAELAGMHPQTLRQYDRLGLVIPARTKGRGRRYTQRDIQRLRDVQRMSQDEGINLAGIQRILDLERQVERLEEERDLLRARLEEIDARANRVFTASPTGEVHQFQRGQRVPRPAVGGVSRTAPADPNAAPVVVWRPWPQAVQGAPRPRVRAVIESPRGSVRVIEGEISTTVIP
ncbi:heat shock protein transcriptional repressor HspR [Schaalia sp. Marseille-Q2122]|uniref:heat shock protein transcriptional repressor HspR n=1 Tax=Schaalia sp. Marseille-Q2122 TaxID=2736604 RepID=UPI001589BCA5|nr:helix-turn-helix transcriptional regulator [Schaalia sp. Marseille-Q2122]